MDWSGTSPPVQGGVNLPRLQIAYIQEVETYRLSSGQGKRLTVKSVVVVLHDGYVIRLWREDGVEASYLFVEVVNSIKIG
jgi:hypothetical protein